MTPPSPTPPPATRAVPADRPQPPGLIGAVVESGGMIAGAARLLWRHWPALVAIFLAGAVARELIMRAAVRASLLNAELGLLVLLLAPMTTLTALVLMLRIVRPSLPWLGSGRAGKPPSVLVHLGSVLVPFMTIYYFEDDLRKDLNNYAYRVWEDYFGQLLVGVADSVETGADGPEIPTSDDRLPFDLSLSLAAVVVAAIVLRWLLGRWPVVERHGWLGVPGAYLELVWFTVVTTLAFNIVTIELANWASTVGIGNAIVGIWEHGVGTASGAGSPPEAVVGWLLGQVGHIDAVLIVPLSWLAIGAVVIGARQPARRSGRRRPAYEKAQQRWLAAPRAIRWAGEQITADLRERFTPLVHGVRMLVRTGAVPILLFCLAFVAARRLADWLWQLGRLVIGPQELGVWVPLAPVLDTVNEAIGTAVLVCLLAAGIDRALRYSEPVEDPPELPMTATADLPPPVYQPAPTALPVPVGTGQPSHAQPGNGNGYPQLPVPPPPGPVAPPAGVPPPVAPQPTSSRT